MSRWLCTPRRLTCIAKGWENVNEHAAELLPKLLAERQAVGLARYGRPLETFNGRDVHRDLVEELINALQYAVQAQMERASLDQELAALRAVVETLRAEITALRAETATDPGPVPEYAPLRYPCAACGAPTCPGDVEWFDTGTTWTCSQCQGKTVLALYSVGDYRMHHGPVTRPGPITADVEESVVRECHGVLDAAGVPSAAHAACDDGECKSQLGHRVRWLVGKLGMAQSEAQAARRLLTQQGGYEVVATATEMVLYAGARAANDL